MSVNHITNKMLEDKPPFQDSYLHKEMKRHADEGDILVCHNVQYDAGMLKKEGIEFKQAICTLKLAHYIDQECKFEKHNLSYLRYFFDIDVNITAHDAYGDIVVLEKVFYKLQDMLQEKENPMFLIDKMVEISSKPTLYRKFNFGKYNGMMVKDVANDHSRNGGRSWMKWLLGEKMSKPEENDADWIYTLDYYLRAYEPTGK